MVLVFRVKEDGEDTAVGTQTDTQPMNAAVRQETKQEVN